MLPFADLYIHLPFCPQKCDYCAFYSLAKSDSALRSRFLGRLAGEMREKGLACGPLETIYLGGGTPTFFPGPELQRLMTLIHDSVQLASGHEFTIEGNPSTLTREKIRLLLDSGVTRFSIGVQSFSRAIRDRIGRGGEIRNIYRAVENLRACGVRNYNCDLIYGVPGQTMREWAADLEKVVELEPVHVSTYSLMVEPGTPLARRGVLERDDEESVEMWQFAGDFLAARCGLRRYEISNYAVPGFECRHNCRIWMGGRFMGAGPAACYFDGVTRWMNPPDLSRWFRAEAPAADHLEAERRAIEILITGLRTVRGWTRRAFRRMTGFDYLELRRPQIRSLVEYGLLADDRHRLRLTEKGLLLANTVGVELL